MGAEGAAKSFFFLDDGEAGKQKDREIRKGGSMGRELFLASHTAGFQ